MLCGIQRLSQLTLTRSPESVRRRRTDGDDVDVQTVLAFRLIGTSELDHRMRDASKITVQ